MNERPIIFNGDMVRAILDGRQTQTRRPIVPQPVSFRNGWYDWGYAVGASRATSPKSVFWNAEAYAERGEAPPLAPYCPFGQPGDRLWVRETWWPEMYYEPCPVLYATDADRPPMGFRWRPSIHMPRWASRITLEITDVRVQRLQEISLADIEHEGVDYWNAPDKSPADAFSTAWDSIYAKRGLGWEQNPWVWAITFRRLEPPNSAILEGTNSMTDTPKLAPPAPGSDAARALGCSCPVSDNCHGAGFIINGKTCYWIIETCPLHGRPALEPEAAT